MDSLIYRLPPPGQEDLYRKLAGYLPLWRRHRERWPLWTGNRDAWAEQDEEWLDRLAWTALTVATRKPAGLEHREDPPRNPTRAYMRARDVGIAWLTDPDLEAAPSPEQDPEAYQNWIRKAARALAHLGHHPWIPPDAAEKLGRSLLDGLFARRDGRTSLLHRFLRFRKAAASGGAGARDEEKGGGASPDELASELCRALGLLPRGRRDRATGLSSETLAYLDQEARQIVSYVRNNPAGEEELAFVARTIEVEDPLEQARRERGLRDEDYRFVFMLRLPFLLRNEIQVARNDDLTKETAAYRLVDGRLVGSLARSTYCRKLSEAAAGE